MFLTLHLCMYVCMYVHVTYVCLYVDTKCPSLFKDLIAKHELRRVLGPAAVSVDDQ